MVVFFFFQSEDGIRDRTVTGVQTCALPILRGRSRSGPQHRLDHRTESVDRARHRPRNQPGERARAGRRQRLHGLGRGAHGGAGVPATAAQAFQRARAQDCFTPRVQEPDVLGHARSLYRARRGPGPELPVRRKRGGAGAAPSGDAGGRERRIRRDRGAYRRAADHARQGARGPREESQGRNAANRAGELSGYSVPRADARAATLGRRRRQFHQHAAALAGEEGGGRMMRLPWFGFHSPKSIVEAAKILTAEGPQAMLIAGGTDLLPNMKRRHQTPATLVSLRQIEALKKISNGSGRTLGAGLTLNEIVANAAVREEYAGLWQAAAQVATVHLRNMGTLGGNLCLDTRCNYYNQNYEWRKAIDFCMKKDGEICWVATASKRCVATSSTDTAPALIALGASVRLVSAQGERDVALADLYRNDGIDYLTRRPDEILTEVKLPVPEGWKSSYWKLRRRGSFDFPVLGVAAAVKTARDGTVEEARIALGAVSSRPLLTKAGELLVGRKLTDEAIAEVGRKVASVAKPMDNADLDLYWRKDVVSEFVGYALREIRGDDMRATRVKIARHDLKGIH